MESANHYLVIVQSLPKDRLPLHEILVENLKMHPTDALKKIHDLPGIVAVDLEQGTALKVARDFLSAGCRVTVASDETLPDLEHSPKLHHVRCHPDGFELVGLDGSKFAVLPWTSFAFLSVGMIPFSYNENPADRFTTASSPGPSSTTKRASSLPKARELWITTHHPDRCFRIEEQEMNYEYLGERKSSSATTNFELLVRDIVKFAPHIALSSSARAYLNHNSILEYSFDSAEEYRRWVRAQIAIVRDLMEHRKPNNETTDSDGDR
ncbi:hypothetical protein AB1L42_16275 [Thalassoglobus sp. JC818]|uniref:hypothetical protein n=1 Tax=Thalassoglobus sp. JC818 TaxID=3232136 RepID=UPI003457CB19